MWGCSPKPVRHHLCLEHLRPGKSKSWQSHSGGLVVAKNQGFFCSGSFTLHGYDHFNNPILGVPLCLNSSLRIDFQGATAIRVSHEFLHDLHVFTVCDQHRGKALSGRVPADMLLNSGTRRTRTDNTRKKDTWPVRGLPLGARAREHPIMGLTVMTKLNSRLLSEGLAGASASQIADFLRVRDAYFGALLVHSSVQMG